MSNHSETSKIHNTQKDTQRKLDNLAGTLKWVLILVCASVGISLISLFLTMAQMK